ncbi:hypothetical protein ECDEC7E_5138 [Escherichia coli DEC7E]|nr:hypothetical protein ECDEC7E_5138 [Escherichia coli DEC7E]
MAGARRITTMATRRGVSASDIRRLTVKNRGVDNIPVD